MTAKAPRGITLLEIMVVVAIVGAMTAMASAAMTELKYVGQSREETRAVVTMLRNARMMAITSGLRHGVYIGGPNDAWNNGSAGTRDLRNRIVIFRRPNAFSAAAQTNDFVPGEDVILAEHQMPTSGPPPGMPMLNNNYIFNANVSVRFTFNPETGVPSLVIGAGGGLGVTPFPNQGGINRHVMRFSHVLKNVAAPGVNPTTRCVEVQEDGSVRVLWNDATFPMCL